MVQKNQTLILGTGLRSYHKGENEMERNGLPKRQGLYDPSLEKGSCGVGFVAHINGDQTNEIIRNGLKILNNMAHRGAVGSDPETGDGAGIMIQIPHDFLKEQLNTLGVTLPEAGDYAVGMVFLPMEPNARYYCEGVFEKIIKGQDLTFLTWRNVPIDNNQCGISARGTCPMVHQLFILRGDLSEEDFNQKLLIVRKKVEALIKAEKKPYTEGFYVCSLSTRVIVYKGQLLAHQLSAFYADLTNETLVSAMAIVHQRYSTNTFPTWSLAHPFRVLSHNGEVNTIKGNRKWMKAREGRMTSKVLGDSLKDIFPIIEEDGSDSANLDNAVELLMASGRTLPHALSMLVPEAWQENSQMDQAVKDFYEFHSGLNEAWDGPATLVFSDGVQIGAKLDRNGLRPCRYQITEDGLFLLASEAGVLETDQKKIIKKGSLEPGKLILVDMGKGQVQYHEEILRDLAAEKDYGKWINENKMTLGDLSAGRNCPSLDAQELKTLQIVFGYTEEELKRTFTSMIDQGTELLSSMGNDTPLAVLTERPKLLFDYFKQSFAQVTNPPIDPIREKMVMSLKDNIGHYSGFLDGLKDKAFKFIALDTPVISNEEMAKIKEIALLSLRPIELPTTFEDNQYGKGLKIAIEALCKRAEEAVLNHYNVIILSDRDVSRYRAPIPALLAVSSVHNYLIDKKLRTSANIVIETGEARDPMHMALLLGYGATAINPYLAFETIADLVKQKLYVEATSRRLAVKNYMKSLHSGILKIISKMGISTLQSYSGAQIFEIIGIDQDIVDRYFTGSLSRINGIGLEIMAEEVLLRHKKAFPLIEGVNNNLEFGSEIHWRKDGDAHLFNPDTLKKLQLACRTEDYGLFKEYSALINDQNIVKSTIRGMFMLKNRTSIPLEDVEPVSEIVKRFATGAMSFGSLSKEAHETIAIAMNRLGGKSNSGEGGEDGERAKPDQNGNWRRSAIKQVAAARFGVDINYLSQAEELQIKVAQGAKPGEGGHLPGHKVTLEIAKVRHSLPGVDLISPPPHHDIYSIEDLEQLIYDLRLCNPTARISVKLVSEAGVGTVAAGVAKGSADMVLVSGHDGGTGAAPVTSIKHCGVPWEIGLSEVQQTLMINNLRGRIRVQVDGQMRTGRDVVIGALLGAEEFGFATAPLVVSGCIMMRKCHNNTCPVGVATQDPELRKHFTGKPEHIINFFTFIAMEVRELLATLGYKTLDEIVGRVDLIEVDQKHKNWKTRSLDLSQILYRPQLPSRFSPKKVQNQAFDLTKVFDQKLIKDFKEAVDSGKAFNRSYDIKNTDRAVGAMLSGMISRELGDVGLGVTEMNLVFEGTAGQSFGAFANKGMNLSLFGEANDYVGKGLSGGRIVLRPDEAAVFEASTNTIAGNTLLYGATSGEAYISGKVGERFAVRNSGAVAVVEGTGNHACEYMTNGVVVILGETGRNIGAGMSGGIIYLFKESDAVTTKINYDTVGVEAMNAGDLKRVKGLIEKHYALTKSVKAQMILKDFQHYGEKFIKIISPNYMAIIGDSDIFNDEGRQVNAIG